MLTFSANPNYDIESWISSILYPPDKVIDGTDFILNLSREEKQRIGLFRKKENDKLLYYSYQTPWGRGAGLGGKTTWSKTKNNSGRDSVQCIEYDTTLIVDYLPKMLTDTLGYPKTMSTTGYYIQSSLITDDHLIPVKHSDVIFWFTQSDSLWTLLPDRYRYLQKIYQRIFFTKSLYPDIDLVRYFEQGRKQIDMDVEILDLSNIELENIGFQFIRDSLATQTSVYNNEWIQIQFNLPGMVLKMLNDGISHFLNFSGLRGGIQIVNEKNKDFKKEHNGLEYDELMKSPFQGFQFVMVTDELGNELVNFRSLARNEYLSGSESQYLIPVRVPFDKYFSEYSETKIFWFTPTEEFFDRLPDRISKNLRQDFYSLIGNLETSSCTYFEECRSTLQLDDFLIYPNPARERITVSFNAADKVTGNIHLVDIKGSIVKKLEAKVNITNGNNEFHYILNDVQPGIYLVAVQSDKGIKTARLIVYE